MITVHVVALNVVPARLLSAEFAYQALTSLSARTGPKFVPMSVSRSPPSVAKVFTDGSSASICGAVYDVVQLDETRWSPTVRDHS